MDYVLIKNGKIVVDGKLCPKDVLIGNDKIIEIENDIERPEPETPVIDANGKILIPGAVDTNILFSDLIGQDNSALIRFNQAHISCGTTTVVEPLNCMASVNCTEELISKKHVAPDINADYGYHLTFNNWESIDAKDVEQCYAHEGIASFYLRWPIKQKKINKVKSLFEVAAKADTPVLIDMQKPGDWEESHAVMSKVYMETITNHLSQLRRVLDLAIQTGCIVCVLNVCFEEELSLIEQTMTDGKIYAELTFPFHIADSDRIVVDDNSIYSGFPIVDKLKLIPEEDIWRCIKHSNFFIARPMMKLSGKGILKDSQVDNRPDEYILMKNLLSVLYTWGVAKGNMSFEQLIDLVSCRTAKFMGVYPQKGIIRIGSDADIIIWNSDYKRNLYCHLPGMHEASSNSFALEGRVEFVFIKGCMVYNGENYSVDKVKGRYLYRSPYL